MKEMVKKYSVLDRVDLPADVRALPKKDLAGLADDVRDYLIETVIENGGHFGANLGVVELTVALHRVFDTPKDKLIWDVGHQAYAHKVLTGRKEQLSTIRKKGGLSPFPKRSESEYDCLGVGHSSTSISAGVGMALAHANEKDRKKIPHVAAVIGDGALTGGMAFEALNHGGDVNADVLVILNDNKMSISPNVGAMDKYLTRLISSHSYLKLRKRGKKILSKVPTVKEIVRRTEEYAKGMITPGTLFEELGWGYYGPIDGHDLDELLLVLNNLTHVHGPRLLHIVTEKGKGYAPAKDDALSLHAVNGNGGDKKATEEQKKTYTEIFGEWMCEKAKKDEKLHAITPAMREGSGLVNFQKQFPERYHDVGIAEQHAVTLGAGLACQGAKPVIAIYSTFLQRGYDQLIHDVAVQNLDVLFAIDRAGLVGPDGPTHAGSFDLSYLRCIPNMVIALPADGDDCRALLQVCYTHPGPAAIRYPKEKTVVVGGEKKIAIGEAEIVRTGEKIAILAWGAMVGAATQAAEELDCTLVNMRFVKPLDEKLLRELAQTHDTFVTIEDNAVMGGAGSAVNEFVMKENMSVKVKNLGLPDAYLDHGSRNELLADAGLDAEGIIKTIKSIV